MLVLAAVEHGYVKSTLGTVGALALTCKYISLTPESNYTTSSLPSHETASSRHPNSLCCHLLLACTFFLGLQKKRSASSGFYNTSGRVMHKDCFKSSSGAAWASSLPPEGLGALAALPACCVQSPLCVADPRSSLKSLKDGKAAILGSSLKHCTCRTAYASTSQTMLRVATPP